MDPALASLFEAVQEACAPGLWSRGVSLSRDLKPLVESRSADEIRLRLPVKDRPVAPLITLWPADAEWHCNCGSKDDPCAHVAAVVIALKAGRVAEAGAETPVAGAAAQVIYRFSKAADGALQVERLLRRGQEITPLTSPLTSLVGGRQAGRTSGPPVAAAQADFAAEHALGAWAKRPGPSAPESSAIPTLLKALEDLQSCSYGEAPVRTSGRALTPRARIVDEGPGIRISSIRDASITERFRNGAVLRGGVLHPASSGGLTDEERRLLDGQGTWIAPERLPDFSARILPKLEDKIAIEIETQKLPREPGGPPRVLLYAEEITGEADDDLLAITPRIVYGSPPVAAQSSLARDIPAEQTQALRVQRELQIRVDQPLTLRGSAAAAWVDAHSTAWEIVGPGRARFETRGELTPRLSARELGSDGPELLELSLDFDLNGAKADAGRVIAAWKRGEERVPLLGGGWARLPKDWLKNYGERALELLERRSALKEGGGVRTETALRARMGALGALLAADLLRETRSSIPAALEKLRSSLDNFNGIPDAKMPADLRAELRPYQKQGAAWLAFLRDRGLGAVLADDMGLGKTLQALCAARGRTLVVAPTSVLPSWAEQIRRFRPATPVAVFHGGGRKLPDLPQGMDAFVVTSHALARLDLGLLSTHEWDTVILDEAQAVKNPESQTAQALFRLPGAFRVALSGTPVENRLEDLWSVFQFAAPGLLPELSEFRDRTVRPIAAGDANAAARLRARIRPLLLRRSKGQVATDLPARSEVGLPVELQAEERQLYDTLLASTRREVLARLKDADDGKGVFAALEWLLRLRQACCDPRLLPAELRGQEGGPPVGSKIELLTETLTTSLADGHRALVFSQWTSFLDLIGEALRAAGVTYLRLDGSTPAPERARIVEAFQTAGGPPVLLMSLKAGGVGLTLTAADHVFLMDPWWNPAAEDQAADRAHRIGQTRPVLIHRLVAQDTVEERIIALQSRKRELMRAALEEGGAAAALTREDLLELLS